MVMIRRLTRHEAQQKKSLTSATGLNNAGLLSLPKTRVSESMHGGYVVVFSRSVQTYWLQ